MARSNTISSKRLRSQMARRRQQQRRRNITLVMVCSGLILVITSAYLVLGRPSAPDPIESRPEDISFEHPLMAVHEMEPTNLASIPFLPKGGPQPKIVVSENFHNFGRVGPSEVVQYEFVIANQGDGPLTISRAYTTCGCTTADFSGTVIPPGKVSVVTLTYDAGYHDARGQTVRRGVIIENNDPNNPQIEIWTQASVRTN